MTESKTELEFECTSCALIPGDPEYQHQIERDLRLAESDLYFETEFHRAMHEWSNAEYFREVGRRNAKKFKDAERLFFGYLYTV